MSFTSQAAGQPGLPQLHPFDPLTPSEIQLAVQILEAAFPGVNLRYKRIDVQEPLKKDVIPYIEAERLGHRLPPRPARVLQTLFHRLDNGAFYKALLNADTKSVIYAKELPKHIQGPIDVDEMLAIEQLCLGHPEVQKEIEKLQLPPGATVCNDPWIYGTDDANETRRLFQCYMYIVAVDHPQNNQYSTPCKFSPVFDGITHELVRIDYLPTGTDGSVVATTTPWKPVKTIQYAHELLDTPLRTDLKPYIVQQPEGPSFSLDGNLVSWQKWRFRVGFNTRDGLVINNVTYDGRNLFYRLSLCEMTVPYGDPRKPFHRKQAFDVGDVGFGVTANQLALGCDCLGHIKYFDGWRTDSTGKPVHLENVICLHEQDNGLQHKHTNYRTNSATAVRNRQLVVQMICTVANYEYIFAYIFDQAAGIELEVRATGILSTSPLDNQNGETVPWGTNVGPGVVAAFHQHMFSFRIDPAIDGFKNTVYYEDSVALPEGEENPYNCGYVTEETILKKSGTANTSVERHRVFKIRNDNVINPITYKPVAYKLQTSPAQMLLMGPKSFNYRRAEFATKPIWVTKFQEDELYSAGEFTNQSRNSEGVEKWVARDDTVENEDVVLWHTFGLTHNPRIEDFPVMPVEKVSVMLKPDGFFTKNPALDVPASTQSFNKSTLHEGASSAAAAASCCNHETGGFSADKAKLYQRVD